MDTPYIINIRITFYETNITRSDDIYTYKGRRIVYAIFKLKFMYSNCVKFVNNLEMEIIYSSN